MYVVFMQTLLCLFFQSTISSCSLGKEIKTAKQELNIVTLISIPKTVFYNNGLKCQKTNPFDLSRYIFSR